MSFGIVNVIGTARIGPMGFGFGNARMVSVDVDSLPTINDVTGFVSLFLNIERFPVPLYAEINNIA